MKTLHIILILFITSSSFAQSFTITGRVTDNDTEEGVPFCNIYIDGEGIGTTSDFDGNYTLTLGKFYDSIAVSALGYDNQRKAMLNQAEQTIDFRLFSSSFDLAEVVVYAGENPANAIVRNIIKNKDDNRLDKYDNYYYEDYTKVELDFHNINDKLVNNRFMSDFKIIYDYMDSLSDDKPFLPIFLKETVSDVYGNKGKTKSELKAIRKSGIKNESVLDALDRMHQPYNIYNNRIKILEKPLVSPFANSGLFYYEYYIEDSTFIEDKWCYNLRFKPKRKQENTFYGDFWVADSSFAVVKLNMWMSKDVNINLVDRIIIFEESHLEAGSWTVSKQKMVIDFSPTREVPGLIGRKTSSYKNYRFNQSNLAEEYNTATVYTDDLTKLEKDDTYWESNRHDTLSENEIEIYEMIDTIQTLPMYQRYYQIGEFIGSGFWVVRKEKNNFGPIRLGPYYNMYYQNIVEGHRFSLGGSVDFLKQTMRIQGQVGYGTQDKDFKYSLMYRWRVKNIPFTMIGVSYFDDIVLTHRDKQSGLMLGNNLFSNSFRRNNLPLRMIRAKEVKVWYEKFWQKGIHLHTIVRNRQLDPYGSMETNGQGFDYAFINNERNTIDTTVNTTEAIIRLRYAVGEKRISGKFKYVSLGTKTSPIIEMVYTKGIKGLFNSEHNYHKLALNFSQWVYANPIGKFRYELQAGKIFSPNPLPMLLLEVPPGNDSYFYNRSQFSTMNQYEFVSDQYFHWQITHHFDGFLLNKIPLIKKLDWRVLATFKGTWGTISDKNRAANILNTSNIRGDIPLRSPSNIPYMEAGVGLENVFKFFQIHAVWRLNYLDNQEAPKFMIQGGVRFAF